MIKNLQKLKSATISDTVIDEDFEGTNSAIMEIDNIYKDSLKEIWNGEKIKKIREQIISKKLNLVCQNCLYDAKNV